MVVISRHIIRVRIADPTKVGKANLACPRPPTRLEESPLIQRGRSIVEPRGYTDFNIGRMVNSSPYATNACDEDPREYPSPMNILREAVQLPESW